MTENERFKVKGFDVYDQVVWDTEFEQSCSVERVVNMLNDKDWVIDVCNEEIEELKQSNKYLQEQLDDYSGVEVDNIELREEIEQLKSVNMEYEDALGRLEEENQKLKTQLLHGDGVCDICKHEYLVKTGEYYVSECKKGHEECSKIDLAYCEDFEVKECKE